MKKLCVLVLHHEKKQRWFYEKMVVDYIGMRMRDDGGRPDEKGPRAAEASRYQTYKGTDHDGEHQDRRKDEKTDPAHKNA